MSDTESRVTGTASPAGDGPADDPMPVFVLKAKDNFAPEAVHAYRRYTGAAGLFAQAEQTTLALDEIIAWRRRHPELCKDPDHEHVPTTVAAVDPRLTEIRSNLLSHLGMLEAICEAMPVCVQGRELRGVIEGGFPEVMDLVERVAGRTPEGDQSFHRGYQVMVLMRREEETGVRDPGAWAQHPADFMREYEAEERKHEREPASAGPPAEPQGECPCPKVVDVEGDDA